MSTTKLRWGILGVAKINDRLLPAFAKAANGGAWFVSGAPHPRWSDDNLHTLRKVKGRDLEVVKMG